MFKIPSLLRSRCFLPLFLTQFLGAFNDNVFKNALVMLIAFKTSMASAQVQILVTLAAGLFILPYFLFSATAGQLADKYDRAMLTRRIKIAEILIMGIAAIGFYTHGVYFLLFVLFCLGIQATFFGPIKYALLPQHLWENELIEGNAWIEAGTFLAILAGTISGGLLIMSEWGTHLIFVAILGVAGLGYLASRHIPPADAPMPELRVNWNIARETWNIIQNDRANPRVFSSILSISWFWLIGATFLSQFPAYARDILHADETVVTLFLTLFSVGVGAGSLLCNRLLRGEVKATHVPLAAWGITLFTVDLFFASPLMDTGKGAWINAWQFLGSFSHWRIMADLFAIAVCGGLFIVPLYAIMQHESDPASRARTIASNNVVNALFMVAAAIGTVLMLKWSFSVPQVFLTAGLLNGAAALYARRLNRPV